MDMQSLIPRLLITLFLVAAAVPLVALNDGSAAPDKQQAQSQAPANATANKFRKVRKPLRDQYIVVLKQDTASEDVEFVANQLLGRHPGNTRAVYRHTIKGFSIQTTEAIAMALSEEPAVEYVQEDGIVYASTTQNNVTWGLDRVDQRNLPLDTTYNFANVTTGAGVHAYVIDSGINILHSEFRNASGFTRASQDANFVWGENANDCKGHGTSVASVIGGNTLGLAKDIRLHSVKVLNCGGWGSTSDIIAGIDWVTNNHINPAVANMSLGGGASSALDTAVNNLANSGVPIAVAAGNSNTDACTQSPARAANAITVGSTTTSDARSSFSNFGTCLDIFAPGSGILSSWFSSDTATATLSGTSMASPHVAGVAALYKQFSPGASASTTRNAIVNGSTTNHVTNAGSGSPNRLLYSLFF